MNKLWQGKKKNIERKTDLNYNRNGSGRGNLFPPTDPDVQTGGFIPILPGSGGFKPMLNPPSEIITTSIPIALITNVTQDFLTKRDPVSKVELSSASNRLDSNSTASSNSNIFNTLYSTSQTITENYIPNMSNKYEEITLTPTDNSILEDGFTTKYEFETIENDSGNIHSSQLTTNVPEEDTTDMATEIYKINEDPNTISSPLTKKNTNNISNKINNISISEKDNSTHLSVFLVPGGQVIPYRPSGKSTITKIPSPHTISTSPLLHPINNVTEQLPLTTKKKKIFSNVNNVSTSQIPPHDRSMSWYFINYNKTNLQPYIDPVLNIHAKNNSNKIYVPLLTVILVSYFLYIM